jgi:hypothetical protein
MHTRMRRRCSDARARARHQVQTAAAETAPTNTNHMPKTSGRRVFDLNRGAAAHHAGAVERGTEAKR